MAHTIITNCLIPESDRLTAVEHIFGIGYVLRLEPTVFTMAERLASEYTGGYWEFHALSNGGFYMAPRSVTGLRVSSENGYEGLMSPDAFGITVCLYAYSELSFRGGALAQTCAEQYHLLRDWAAEHPEATAIYAAID
jgi:Antirestriction protein